MVLILSLFVLLCGFIAPCDKKITKIMYAWMWILFAFNTNNADYNAYMRIYKNIVQGKQYTIDTYEKGYVFVCKLCGEILKLDYKVFVILIALLTMILFAMTITLYCKEINQNIVISLFMIFLYWIYICQYRSYISLLFVLIGIYWLYRKEGTIGNVGFFIFIFLGALFHTSALFFLILFFIKKIDINKIFYLVPIVVLLGVFLRSNFTTNILAQFIPAYKMQNWLYSDGTRSVYGVVLTIFSRISLPCLEYYIYKQESCIKNIDTRYIKLQEMIIKCTCLCLMIVPLELLVKDYERISRLSIFFLLIFLAYYTYEHEVTLRKIPLELILMILYLIIYMVTFYISHSAWFGSVLIPVLTENMIFSW